MCPDALTNETQMRPLYSFSNEPFCVLELRSEFIKLPATPTHVKKAVSRNMTPKSTTQKRQAPIISESEASDSDAPIVAVAKKQKKGMKGRALVL